MISALIGAILIIWSCWAGLGTYEQNRAPLFQGPAGAFVSLGIIIIGYCLIVYGLNISIRNALIFVGVVGVIIIYAQSHKINPENKTDSQLWKLHDMHVKHGLTGFNDKNYHKIVDEMNKRGLFHELYASLNPQERDKLYNANKFFEETGAINEIKAYLVSGKIEKMYSKIFEIAEIKNMTPRDASQYFFETLQKMTDKYMNDGLSENDAHARALDDFVALKIVKDN